MKVVFEGASINVTPGEYKARCVKIAEPVWLRTWGRWSMRLDFELDETGEIVPFYCALNGESKDSGYRVGRASKLGRLVRMVPTDDTEKLLDSSLVFTVEVESITRDDDGAMYSRVAEVTKVKREAEITF